MSLEKLQQLHGLLAEAMLNEVEEAIADGYPVPAADKGAIAKFLKDNGITADPAANADLDALRAALTGAENPRSTKLAAKLEEIDADAVRGLYLVQ